MMDFYNTMVIFNYTALVAYSASLLLMGGLAVHIVRGRK